MISSKKNLWKPISPVEDPTIFKFLSHIYQFIVKEKTFKDLGIYTGKMGNCLFLFHFLRFKKHPLDEAYQMLQAINEELLDIDSLSEKKSLELCEFGRFTFILYHEGFLNKEKIEDVTSEFDPLFLRCMSMALQAKFYNLYTGALNWGLYFLEKYIIFHKESDKRALEVFIELLLEKSTNISEDKIGWENILSLKYPDTRGYNLGFPYGIGSIIQFCSRLYQLGISKNETEDIISRSLNLLLESRQDKLSNIKTLFPYGVKCDLSVITGDSPLSWSGGDLMIATVLKNTLLNHSLKSSLKIKENFDDILNNFERRLELDLKIKENNIMAGKAGIAITLNSLYQSTNDPRLKDYVLFWQENMLNSEMEKKSNDDNSLICGLSGIGLVLLANLETQKPYWISNILLL